MGSGERKDGVWEWEERVVEIVEVLLVPTYLNMLSFFLRIQYAIHDIIYYVLHFVFYNINV